VLHKQEGSVRTILPADQVTALAPRARPHANAPFDARARFRDTSRQRA